jgi:hypothetical protein
MESPDANHIDKMGQWRSEKEEAAIQAKNVELCPD